MIKKLLARTLRRIADKIDNDTCDINEAEALEMLSAIAKEPMSKEEACLFLNLSRATFDRQVVNGTIPKGKKRRGFKELVWYRSDLELLRNDFIG